VANALREQNRQGGGRHFGQATDPPGTTVRVHADHPGPAVRSREFEDVILRTDAEGRKVRIKDVGYVVLGARNMDTTIKVDHYPPAPRLWALADANLHRHGPARRDRMEELKKEVPRGHRSIRSPWT